MTRHMTLPRRTTYYLHPGDVGFGRGGKLQGLVVKRYRRLHLFSTIPSRDEWNVEVGEFDMLGFHGDRIAIVATDRRRAKRIARKVAKAEGLIPRQVWRRRNRAITG